MPKSILIFFSSPTPNMHTQLTINKKANENKFYKHQTLGLIHLCTYKGHKLMRLLSWRQFQQGVYSSLGQATVGYCPSALEGSTKLHAGLHRTQAGGNASWPVFVPSNSSPSPLWASLANFKSLMKQRFHMVLYCCTPLCRLFYCTCRPVPEGMK